MGIYTRFQHGMAALSLIVTFNINAQNIDAELVRNINFSGNSTPSSITNVNGILYFSANDGANGSELWKSDGTPGGTLLVKNINQGSLGSSPRNLINVNGTLFFRAFDSNANGSELWKSNGTFSGTQLVKDIYSGPNTSRTSNFTNVNGTLYFSADDGSKGIELWKSDGTDTGTVMIKDINQGNGNASLGFLTNVNGTLFFRAFDSNANGSELWKSNGTFGGTIMVKDIFLGASSSSLGLPANVNGTLFFIANNGIDGVELWKTKPVISNFSDVPPGAFGFQFIEDFFGAQVTGGCTPGNYCPNDPVTRAQMAVFLEKAIRGANYTPPPATGRFTDVAVSSPFAAWIEKLAVDGITGGCGTNIYCPEQTVTRGQMAVFIEKALRGPGFIPPPATGAFNDVPASNGFAPWIEQLANDNITGGCGGGNYCPNNPVTRAQMAIFMGKAFELGFVD